MDKPKTIYKYQESNTINLLNLKKHVLYMSSPLKFNDPFDCAMKFHQNNYSDEEILFFKNELIKTEKSIVNKKVLSDLSISEFREALETGASKVINSVRDKVLNENGVCCFSQENGNLLMWAHYCNGYNGFCLEFRTEFEPFNKLFKVNYVPSFPKIDFLSNIFQDNAELLIQLYLTKSRIWDYEKEWRVIHVNAGTEYHYQPECLKAIYFGPKLDKQMKEIICLILQGQNPGVELWDGKLSENDFTLNFTQIKYFSHIQAKEQGLQ